MSRKHKPSTPEQIAAAKAARLAAARETDFLAVGLSEGQSALTANADVVVSRANQKRIQGARRLDAFEALKESLRAHAGAYDAARRLERDILISRGEHDRGRPMARVDNRDDGPGRIDAMIAAGGRVKKVLAHVGMRDGWLLHELVLPSTETTVAATTWRDIVQYITGEENPVAQAAAVRAACVNLAAAYRALEAKKAA